STRFGTSFTEAAAGPVIGAFSQLMKAIGQTKEASMGLSDADPTNAWFQLVKNNTPFINLFYLRSILDYSILYNIQEKISPGSLRRMERRLLKEQGQEYILPPSQYASGQ